MVGRDDQNRLDRLIGEVARGERDLSSIRDARLREAVRLALRLHQDPPSAPDAYTRARMRARIMAGLRPRRPTLLDNAWTALELLARPAPYIVRGIATASVLVCLGMGAVVASADSLPDDALYPLKLASEQVRLALADAPGDRAGVELSIADHRLREAETLAGNGRTSDALVASAMYSQHIASAAAELAPEANTDLGTQLESTFSAQRERAQALASTLATDVKSERGAQILALIASPTMAPGATKIERVADTAATLAVGLADAAEAAAVVQPTDTPRTTEAQSVTTTQRAAESAPITPRVTATARTTDRPTNTPHATATAGQTRDPRASDAAKITRKAADDARAAAEKLKQALKQSKDKHD